MIDFGIIAAGDGSRVKEEGSEVVKPLLKIENQPMIGRLISLMENCGGKSVSIIVNSDMPEVSEYLQGLVPEINCELKWISAKTPSSMHSFYELVKLINPEDKFIITTVDTIFKGSDFKKYVEFFKDSPKEVDGVMGVTGYIDDEKPLYVKTGKENHIVGFEDSYEEGLRFVSGGIYGLRQTSLPILKECIEKGVTRMRNFQRSLVSSGLDLLAYDLGKVLDVDHLADIKKANEFLRGESK